MRLDSRAKDGKIMKPKFCVVACLFLLTAFVPGVARSQEQEPKKKLPETTKPDSTPIVNPAEICSSEPCCNPCSACALSRFWVSGEYLLWWTRGVHLPALVTTSPQGTPASDAGVL